MKGGQHERFDNCFTGLYGIGGIHSLVRDEMTRTFEPFEPFVRHPKDDSLAMHHRENLLREALPYLRSIEHGTRTSSVLRALIADVEQVIK